MRITFKDKARADEKAQHTWEYVSILKRLATPYLGVRCIFEMACSIASYFTYFTAFFENKSGIIRSDMKETGMKGGEWKPDATMHLLTGRI